MGYTHYFQYKTVSDEIWELIVNDCVRLVENKPQDIVLVHWSDYNDGSTENVIDAEGILSVTESVIAFNGRGEEGHETFVLGKDGTSDFCFCKTAGKPYDLLVCACLIAYNFHSSETIDVSSDGDWDDWLDAMKFVEKVLGAQYVMKFKMEVDLS